VIPPGGPKGPFVIPRQFPTAGATPLWRRVASSGHHDTLTRGPSGGRCHSCEAIPVVAGFRKFPHNPAPRSPPIPHVAHLYKTAHGWRAQVARAGKRLSATRATKAEALAWATTQEAEILAGKRGEIIPRSVSDALDTYAAKVSPTKRGARWEQVRLTKMAGKGKGGSLALPFRGMLCQDVRPSDVASWRDLALASGLAPASVRREMVLLRSVFERARREWGWLASNPMTGVHYPEHGAPRKRRVSDDELERLLLACGWGDGELAELATQRVGVAILWAVETGMRAGELVGLQWCDIDEAARSAKLPKTKNGDERQVPLSKAALALLPCLPKEERPVFGLTSQTLDTLFRRVRDKANLEDLHFHDLRHEAITRLARKLDVLDLARMIGHKDLKSLMIYYNATAAEIAARLD
jgi:integrase